MSLESLLIVLVIGAVAGWLAGQIRQGYRFWVIRQYHHWYCRILRGRIDFQCA